MNIDQLIKYLETRGHKFTATLEGLNIEPAPTGYDQALYREYYWHIYRRFFREMAHEKAHEAIGRLRKLLPIYPDQKEQFTAMIPGIVELGATTDPAEVELFYDRVVAFIDAVTMLEEYHASQGSYLEEVH